MGASGLGSGNDEAIETLPLLRNANLDIVGVRDLGLAESMCTLGRDYLVRCDALNWLTDYARPGHGEPQHHYSPRRLENLPPIRTSHGTGLTHCAVDQSDHLHCWGADLPNRGTVGDGVGRNGGLAPFNNLSGVLDVDMIHSHGCAVLLDGSVWCWGWGALGRPEDETSSNFRALSSTSNMPSVSRRMRSMPAPFLPTERPNAGVTMKLVSAASMAPTQRFLG